MESESLSRPLIKREIVPSLAGFGRSAYGTYLSKADNPAMRGDD